MSVKIGRTFYLSLLILFIIQGIESRDNIDKSLDLLIRKKRIIDTSPNANTETTIQEIPYIVNILIVRLRTPCCAGNILSPYFLISAAHCFYKKKPSEFHVLSNSENRTNGRPHFVLDIIPHLEFHPPKFENDLALLKIYPRIDLIHSYNQEIKLYNRPIQPNEIGRFSGWGCIYYTSPTEMVLPEQLRSINLPVISLDDCEKAYFNITRVTDLNFCTHDGEGHKRSCHGDSGGPFVINGTLAGIMSWSLANRNKMYPDIFLNLARPEYHRWIRSYVPLEP